ncbi:hypothetical protein Dimus_023884 [Dionaea muscipula]
MAGGVGRPYGGGGSNMTSLLHSQTVPCSSQPPDSFFNSGSSPSFMGSSSMVSFEKLCGVKRSDRSLFLGFDQDENGDEDLDDCLHPQEKKRRLTAEQVQFLERSFEAENKLLETEKKIQLANDLGLQPRRVAIWFQNRRARWKTKQLENDFDTLQTSYNSLKADYDNLLKEKEKLKAEVLHLEDKLQIVEKDQQGQLESSSSYVDNLLQPNEHSSAKGEDGWQYSSFVEPGGDSSYDVSEPDQSDLSHDEVDNFSIKSLMPACYLFRDIGDDVSYPEPPSYSCNFGLGMEDHATWFWSL